VISIPDVEAHIHHELSRSPSPTSRHVGVPLPSRTLPRTARLRDRRVQIFDSQPLSSPRSIASSLNVGSYGFSSGLNKLEPIAVPSSDPDTVRGSPGSSSSSPSISPITSALKPNAAEAVNAPASFNTPPTSMGSAASAIQKFFKAPSAHGIAASGLTTASVMASIVQNEAETVIEGELRAALSSSIIGDKPPTPTSSPSRKSSSATPPVAHAPSTAGRSLLSQTAPPDVVEIKRAAALPRPQPVLPAIGVKIADLGNATPSRKHYTEDIQTRQYRCPEAILGRRDWGARADVWSVACVVFELLTAEYLFDPRGQGMLFSKDDDHMAQIIELMGDFPLEAKTGGKYSREIFDHTGKGFYFVLRYP
jgi:serine/threonine-protein kinase SRPK3